MSLDMMDDIRRYLDNGWEWRTILKMINFKYGVLYSIRELKQDYEKTRVASSLGEK